MVRETRYLIVRNLPENCTEETVIDHFQRYGKIQSVKLQAAKDNDTDSTATVAFNDIKSAAKAHHAKNSIGDVTLRTDYWEGSTSTPVLASTPVVGTSSVRSAAYTTSTPASSRLVSTFSSWPKGTDEDSSNAHDKGDVTQASAPGVTTPVTASAALDKLSSTSFDLQRGRGRERIKQKKFGQKFEKSGSFGRHGTTTSTRSLEAARSQSEAAAAAAAAVASSSTITSMSSSATSIPTTSNTSGSSNSSGLNPIIVSDTKDLSSRDLKESNRESSSRSRPHSVASPSSRNSGVKKSNSQSRSVSRSRSRSRGSRSSSCRSHSSGTSQSTSPHRSHTSSTTRPQSMVGTSRLVNSEVKEAKREENDGERRPLGICVMGLPIRSTDTSLRDGLYHEYKKHGKVTSVQVYGEGDNRYAIISFRKPEDASTALEASQGKTFFGHKIKVSSHEGVEATDTDRGNDIDGLDEYHVKSTRTLFVGNLEKDTTTQDLIDKFKKFGDIIDVDIKRQGAATAFAFVQYADIVSVVSALREMDGEHIGANKIKLGFGKSMPTCCVWLDCLPSDTSNRMLRSTMSRYGEVTYSCVDRNRNRAIVYFSSYDNAQHCVNHIKVKPHFKNKKLQIDFASRECQTEFLDRMESTGQLRANERPDESRFHNYRQQRSFENFQEDGSPSTYCSSFSRSSSNFTTRNGRSNNGSTSYRRSRQYGDSSFQEENHSGSRRSSRRQEEFTQSGQFYSSKGSSDDYDAVLREYGHSQRERRERDISPRHSVDRRVDNQSRQSSRDHSLDRYDKDRTVEIYNSRDTSPDSDHNSYHSENRYRSSRDEKYSSRDRYEDTKAEDKDFDHHSRVSRNTSPYLHNHSTSHSHDSDYEHRVGSRSQSPPTPIQEDSSIHRMYYSEDYKRSVEIGDDYISYPSTQKQKDSDDGDKLKSVSIPSNKLGAEVQKTAGKSRKRTHEESGLSDLSKLDSKLLRKLDKSVVLSEKGKGVSDKEKKHHYEAAHQMLKVHERTGSPASSGSHGDSENGSVSEGDLHHLHQEKHHILRKLQELGEEGLGTSEPDSPRPAAKVKSVAVKEALKVSGRGHEERKCDDFLKGHAHRRQGVKARGVDSRRESRNHLSEELSSTREDKSLVDEKDETFGGNSDSDYGSDFRRIKKRRTDSNTDIVSVKNKGYLRPSSVEVSDEEEDLDKKSDNSFRIQGSSVVKRLSCDSKLGSKSYTDPNKIVEVSSCDSSDPFKGGLSDKDLSVIKHPKSKSNTYFPSKDWNMDFSGRERSPVGCFSPAYSEEHTQDSLSSGTLTEKSSKHLSPLWQHSPAGKGNSDGDYGYFKDFTIPGSTSPDDCLSDDSIGGELQPAPGEPSVEERIRAIDEMLNMTNSNKSSDPSLLMSVISNKDIANNNDNSALYSKFRIRKREGGLDGGNGSVLAERKPEPSVIMQQVLSKKSILDQDFKRLEQMNEKYELGTGRELSSLLKTEMSSPKLTDLKGESYIKPLLSPSSLLSSSPSVHPVTTSSSMLQPTVTTSVAGSASSIPVVTSSCMLTTSIVTSPVTTCSIQISTKPTTVDSSRRSKVKSSDNSEDVLDRHTICTNSLTLKQDTVPLSLSSSSVPVVTFSKSSSLLSLSPPLIAGSSLVAEGAALTTQQSCKFVESPVSLPSLLPSHVSSLSTTVSSITNLQQNLSTSPYSSLLPSPSLSVTQSTSGATAAAPFTQGPDKSQLTPTVGQEAPRLCSPSFTPENSRTSIGPHLPGNRSPRITSQKPDKDDPQKTNSKTDLKVSVTSDTDSKVDELKTNSGTSVSPDIESPISVQSETSSIASVPLSSLDNKSSSHLEEKILVSPPITSLQTANSLCSSGLNISLKNSDSSKGESLSSDLDVGKSVLEVCERGVESSKENPTEAKEAADVLVSRKVEVIPTGLTQMVLSVGGKDHSDKELSHVTTDNGRGKSNSISSLHPNSDVDKILPSSTTLAPSTSISNLSTRPLVDKSEKKVTGKNNSKTPSSHAKSEALFAPDVKMEQPAKLSDSKHHHSAKSASSKSNSGDKKSTKQTSKDSENKDTPSKESDKPEKKSETEHKSSSESTKSKEANKLKDKRDQSKDSEKNRQKEKEDAKKKEDKKALEKKAEKNTAVKDDKKIENKKDKIVEKSKEASKPAQGKHSRLEGTGSKQDKKQKEKAAKDVTSSKDKVSKPGEKKFLPGLSCITKQDTPEVKQEPKLIQKGDSKDVKSGKNDIVKEVAVKTEKEGVKSETPMKSEQKGKHKSDTKGGSRVASDAKSESKESLVTSNSSTKKPTEIAKPKKEQEKEGANMKQNLSKQGDKVQKLKQKEEEKNKEKQRLKEEKEKQREKEREEKEVKEKEEREKQKEKEREEKERKEKEERERKEREEKERERQKEREEKERKEKEKEERERQKEKEEREKQKEKEREEKEQQKEMEREERERLKEKEKEEKEKQKEKEREERERQKEKEREDKERQKEKEREEKERQKEKEEKERKEREEKEKIKKEKEGEKQKQKERDEKESPKEKEKLDKKVKEKEEKQKEKEEKQKEKEEKQKEKEEKQKEKEKKEKEKKEKQIEKEKEKKAKEEKLKKEKEEKAKKEKHEKMKKEKEEKRSKKEKEKAEKERKEKEEKDKKKAAPKKPKRNELAALLEHNDMIQMSFTSMYDRVKTQRNREPEQQHKSEPAPKSSFDMFKQNRKKNGKKAKSDLYSEDDASGDSDGDDVISNLSESEPTQKPEQAKEAKPKKTKQIKKRPHVSSSSSSSCEEDDDALLRATNTKGKKTDKFNEIFSSDSEEDNFQPPSNKAKSSAKSKIKPTPKRRKNREDSSDSMASRDEFLKPRAMSNITDSLDDMDMSEDEDLKSKQKKTKAKTKKSSDHEDRDSSMESLARKPLKVDQDSSIESVSKKPLKSDKEESPVKKPKSESKKVTKAQDIKSKDESKISSSDKKKGKNESERNESKIEPSKSDTGKAKSKVESDSKTTEKPKSKLEGEKSKAKVELLNKFNAEKMKSKDEERTKLKDEEKVRNKLDSENKLEVDKKSKDASKLKSEEKSRSKDDDKGKLKTEAESKSEQEKTKTKGDLEGKSESEKLKNKIESETDKSKTKVESEHKFDSEKPRSKLDVGSKPEADKIKTGVEIDSKSNVDRSKSIESEIKHKSKLETDIKVDETKDGKNKSVGERKKKSEEKDDGIVKKKKKKKYDPLIEEELVNSLITKVYDKMDRTDKKEKKKNKVNIFDSEPEDTLHSDTSGGISSSSTKQSSKDGEELEPVKLKDGKLDTKDGVKSEKHADAKPAAEDISKASKKKHKKKKDKREQQKELVNQNKEVVKKDKTANTEKENSGVSLKQERAAKVEELSDSEHSKPPKKKKKKKEHDRDVDKEKAGKLGKSSDKKSDLEKSQTSGDEKDNSGLSDDKSSSMVVDEFQSFWGHPKPILIPKRLKDSKKTDEDKSKHKDEAKAEGGSDKLDASTKVKEEPSDGKDEKMSPDDVKLLDNSPDEDKTPESVTSQKIEADTSDDFLVPISEAETTVVTEVASIASTESAFSTSDSLVIQKESPSKKMEAIIPEETTIGSAIEIDDDDFPSLVIDEITETTDKKMKKKDKRLLLKKQQEKERNDHMDEVIARVAMAVSSDDEDQNSLLIDSASNDQELLLSDVINQELKYDSKLSSEPEHKSSIIFTDKEKEKKADNVSSVQKDRETKPASGPVKKETDKKKDVGKIFGPLDEETKKRDEELLKTLAVLCDPNVDKPVVIEDKKHEPTEEEIKKKEEAEKKKAEEERKKAEEEEKARREKEEQAMREASDEAARAVESLLEFQSEYDQESVDMDDDLPPLFIEPADKEPQVETVSMSPSGDKNDLVSIFSSPIPDKVTANLDDKLLEKNLDEKGALDQTDTKLDPFNLFVTPSHSTVPAPFTSPRRNSSGVVTEKTLEPIILSPPQRQVQPMPQVQTPLPPQMKTPPTPQMQTPPPIQTQPPPQRHVQPPPQRHAQTPPQVQVQLPPQIQVPPPPQLQSPHRLQFPQRPLQSPQHQMQSPQKSILSPQIDLHSPQPNLQSPQRPSFFNKDSKMERNFMLTNTEHMPPHSEMDIPHGPQPQRRVSTGPPAQPLLDQSIRKPQTSPRRKSQDFPSEQLILARRNTISAPEETSVTHLDRRFSALIGSDVIFSKERTHSMSSLPPPVSISLDHAPHDTNSQPPMQTLTIPPHPDNILLSPRKISPPGLQFKERTPDPPVFTPAPNKGPLHEPISHFSKGPIQEQICPQYTKGPTQEQMFYGTKAPAPEFFKLNKIEQQVLLHAKTSVPDKPLSQPIKAPEPMLIPQKNSTQELLLQHGKGPQPHIVEQHEKGLLMREPLFSPKGQQDSSFSYPDQNIDFLLNSPPRSNLGFSSFPPGSEVSIPAATKQQQPDYSQDPLFIAVSEASSRPTEREPPQTRRAEGFPASFYQEPIPGSKPHETVTVSLQHQAAFEDDKKCNRKRKRNNKKPTNEDRAAALAEQQKIEESVQANVDSIRKALNAKVAAEKAVGNDKKKSHDAYDFEAHIGQDVGGSLSTPNTDAEYSNYGETDTKPLRSRNERGRGRGYGARRGRRGRGGISSMHEPPDALQRPDHPQHPQPLSHFPSRVPNQDNLQPHIQQQFHPQQFPPSQPQQQPPPPPFQRQISQPSQVTPRQLPHFYQHSHSSPMSSENSSNMPTPEWQQKQAPHHYQHNQLPQQQQLLQQQPVKLPVSKSDVLSPESNKQDLDLSYGESDLIINLDDQPSSTEGKENQYNLSSDGEDRGLIPSPSTPKSQRSTRARKQPDYKAIASGNVQTPVQPRTSRSGGSPRGLGNGAQSPKNMSPWTRSTENISSSPVVKLEKLEVGRTTRSRREASGKGYGKDNLNDGVASSDSFEDQKAKTSESMPISKENIYEFVDNEHDQLVEPSLRSARARKKRVSDQDLPPQQPLLDYMPGSPASSSNSSLFVQESRHGFDGHVPETRPTEDNTKLAPISSVDAIIEAVSKGNFGSLEEEPSSETAPPAVSEPDHQPAPPPTRSTRRSTESKKEADPKAEKTFTIAEPPRFEGREAGRKGPTVPPLRIKVAHGTKIEKSEEKHYVIERAKGAGTVTEHEKVPLAFTVKLSESGTATIKPAGGTSNVIPGSQIVPGGKNQVTIGGDSFKNDPGHKKDNSLGLFSGLPQNEQQNNEMEMNKLSIPNTITPSWKPLETGNEETSNNRSTGAMHPKVAAKVQASQESQNNASQVPTSISHPQYPPSSIPSSLSGLPKSSPVTPATPHGIKHGWSSGLPQDSQHQAPPSDLPPSSSSYLPTYLQNVSQMSSPLTRDPQMIHQQPPPGQHPEAKQPPNAHSQPMLRSAGPVTANKPGGMDMNPDLASKLTAEAQKHHQAPFGFPPHVPPAHSGQRLFIMPSDQTGHHGPHFPNSSLLKTSSDSRPTKSPSIQQAQTASKMGPEVRTQTPPVTSGAMLYTGVVSVQPHSLSPTSASPEGQVIERIQNPIRQTEPGQSPSPLSLHLPGSHHQDPTSRFLKDDVGQDGSAPLPGQSERAPSREMAMYQWKMEHERLHQHLLAAQNLADSPRNLAAIRNAIESSRNAAVTPGGSRKGSLTTSQPVGHGQPLNLTPQSDSRGGQTDPSRVTPKSTPPAPQSPFPMSYFERKGDPSRISATVTGPFMQPSPGGHREGITPHLYSELSIANLTHSPYMVNRLSIDPRIYSTGQQPLPHLMRDGVLPGSFTQSFPMNFLSVDHQDGKKGESDQTSHMLRSPSPIQRQLQGDPLRQQLTRMPCDLPTRDSPVGFLQRYPVMWQGALALKNDNSYVQMHFIAGNRRLPNQALPQPMQNGALPPLRISQRMRLEHAQLEGVAKRMQCEDHYCILIAVACGRDQVDINHQTRALNEGFITYLLSKQAAGIVNVPLPGSEQVRFVVHIFPPCDFVDNSVAQQGSVVLMEQLREVPHAVVIIATT